MTAAVLAPLLAAFAVWVAATGHAIHSHSHSGRHSLHLHHPGRVQHLIAGRHR